MSTPWVTIFEVPHLNDNWYLIDESACEPHRCFRVITNTSTNLGAVVSAISDVTFQRKNELPATI